MVVRVEFGITPTSAQTADRLGRLVRVVPEAFEDAIARPLQKSLRRRQAAATTPHKSLGSPRTRWPIDSGLSARRFRVRKGATVGPRTRQLRIENTARSDRGYEYPAFQERSQTQRGGGRNWNRGSLRRHVNAVLPRLLRNALPKVDAAIERTLS